MDPGISEGRRGFQKRRHTSAKVRRHAPAKNVESKVLKKVISSVLRDNCKKKKNKQTNNELHVLDDFQFSVRGSTKLPGSPLDLP